MSVPCGGPRKRSLASGRGCRALTAREQPAEAPGRLTPNRRAETVGGSSQILNTVRIGNDAPRDWEQSPTNPPFSFAPAAGPDVRDPNPPSPGLGGTTRSNAG